MREILSTITSKGQITIPVEVRKLLGLKQGDRVAFMITDHQVILRRTGSVVAATAGALKSNRLFLSAEELREAAADSIAEVAAERAEQ